MTKFALLTLISLCLGASAALAQDTSAPVAAPVVGAASSLPIQVNIAVGDFKCSAAKCYGNLGSSVAESLTTALLNTGKFSVMERQNLGQLNEEAFASGGAAFQGADLVIFGAITQFEPEAQSGGFSLGGLLSVGKKESSIGVDLRIVDVKSRRTIAGTHVDGTSSSQGVSLNIVGNMGASSNGGVEKAVASMLKQAVDQLVARIPTNYYK